MPRRRLLPTVSTLVVVALAVAGCTIPTTKDGGGYGPSSQTARKDAPPPVELRSGARQQLKSTNAAWTPALYETATGAKVVLNVSNTDPAQHNFTLGELEISRNIPPDKSALISFTAPQPGRYRFYCKYHQQEMQGWLTVK